MRCLRQRSGGSCQIFSSFQQRVIQLVVPSDHQTKWRAILMKPLKSELAVVRDPQNQAAYGRRILTNH